MTELRTSLTRLFTQTNRQLFLAILGTFIALFLAAMTTQLTGLNVGLLTGLSVILLTVIYIVRLRREDEIDQRLRLLEADLTDNESVAALRRERDLLLAEHSANLDVLEEQVKGKQS